MKRLVISRRALRWTIPFALLMIAVLVVPFPGSSQPTTRHITIDADHFAFAPGRVHVNRGDRVIVDVTASDVVHGFYLDGYGVQRRVEPGVTERIEFVADKAGKFRYRCAVTCGPLHPFMTGELIVEANTPYWRAVGLVGAAAAGMLIYLWQLGKKQAAEVIGG